MSDNGDPNLGYQEPADGLPVGTAARTTLSDRVKSLRLGSPSAQVRVRSSKVPWVLTIVLAFAVIFLLMKNFGKPSEDPTKAVLPVAADKADSKDVALESKGYIVPAHQIQIIPKISGMVTQLKFVEGDKVKKNQLLAKLEDIDYVSDFKHAEENFRSAEWRLKELTNGSRPEEIRQAKGELDEAVSTLAQLKLDWERSARLKNDTLSQKEREQAQYAYEAQIGRVEKLRMAYQLVKIGPREEKISAAKADYQLAKADLDKAKWRLDNCDIVSPIDGTILSKKTEEGSVVFPNSFNTAAYICDMANLRDLEVDLAIQERDINQVYRRQKCRILSEAYPTREPYEGWVDRLMPIADRAKGAVTVRVKVKPKASEDPGSILKPDMGVIVSFLKEKISDNDLSEGMKAIKQIDSQSKPAPDKTDKPTEEAKKDEDSKK
ncbi:MAG: HlyD family secretion protein [Gemmataceae bacterium]